MIVFRIFKLSFLVYATYRTFNKLVDLIGGTKQAARNIKR